MSDIYRDFLQFVIVERRGMVAGVIWHCTELKQVLHEDYCYNEQSFVLCFCVYVYVCVLLYIVTIVAVLTQ